MKDKFYSIYIKIKFNGLDIYLLRDKIEFEMNICNLFFQYLRLRGCKGVYTRILNPADGLIKIVYQKGHANPNDIKNEITQIVKDYAWEVNSDGRAEKNTDEDGE